MLEDIYWAEKSQIAALPRICGGATTEELEICSNEIAVYGTLVQLAEHNVNWQALENE